MQMEFNKRVVFFNKLKIYNLKNCITYYYFTIALIFNFIVYFV